MQLKEKVKKFRKVIEGLNEAQRQSVLSDAKMLQVLAGPGSGKTRVLTCRVAYYVLIKRIPPQQIIVVTFTNKAADEMKQRLFKLIGEKETQLLLIGTFHAICSRLLRRNHAIVGLDANYTIADTDASRDIMSEILKDKAVEIDEWTRSNMTAGAVCSIISKAKNDGMTARDYYDAYRDDFSKKNISALFTAYEEKLHELNLVDFDNLLLKGRELLTKRRTILANIKAVLVDEYQDTNVVQYDLVKLITRQENTKERFVTTVGDPDQSIFGWRSADPKNFFRMQEDFVETKQINMEQNYRSTSMILKSALHVITQDKKRIVKSLYTNNPDGVPIALLEPEDEEDQVRIITKEIRKIIKLSKGLIQYKDIAILMRMNYISRQFETTFRRNKIPFSIVGGDRFFDRIEVKDILCYLRFAYNPKDHSAFKRIINVPRRKIGEKSLEKLVEFKKKNASDFLEAIHEICYGRCTNSGIAAAMRNKLKEFVTVIDSIRNMINDQTEISEILTYIIKAIDYEKYLEESHHKDFQARMANIGELITLSKKNISLDDDEDYVPMTQSQRFGNNTNHANLENHSHDPPEFENITVVEAESSDEDLDIPDIDDAEMEIDPTASKQAKSKPATSNVKTEKTSVGGSASDTKLNDNDEKTPALDYIAEFLEYCSLCSNQKELEAAEEGKVTIATMHTSKGLEWPVVFIVTCVDGVIPLNNNEDANEEGRLLYVAMTRSKFFLYCLSPVIQNRWGKRMTAQPSRFFEGMNNKLYRRCVPDVNNEIRRMLAETIGSPVPEDDDILVRKSTESRKKYRSSRYVETSYDFGADEEKDVDVDNMMSDTDEEYFAKFEEFETTYNTSSQNSSSPTSLIATFGGFQSASSLKIGPKPAHKPKQEKSTGKAPAQKQTHNKNPPQNRRKPDTAPPKQNAHNPIQLSNLDILSTSSSTPKLDYGNYTLFIPKKCTKPQPTVDTKKRTTTFDNTVSLPKRNKKADKN
ncbi:P-loop containing nucleoside triphosphate hydrolase protein [Mycotypha africana]|uniref:P-loop containing nucleoside triphosphate hydrolase protein n=1 Tax=Mycotypha africana TaxID=64632 RepID=UPI002300EDB5|nr:P-loop containing nucleoside triphosphate hydrolase protein [Mycotypha africana]KAI8991764.1 P-loop containing nucleoside triphosphate hydrolase protein [Mycotypha africana]